MTNNAKETCNRLHHEHTAFAGCGSYEEDSFRPHSFERKICSRDNAIVFISVIMVATERQLIVNVELGLVIMERTVIFSIVPEKTFHLPEI